MSRSVIGCPYLRRVSERVDYPIAGYCEGCSMCALRVVTIGEFETFCNTGNYRPCPIYRFGAEAENSLRAP
ncbi:MAG: hypothetical protein ACREP8_12005 [Candidatus Binatia bacterium]